LSQTKLEKKKEKRLCGGKGEERNKKKDGLNQGKKLATRRPDGRKNRETGGERGIASRHFETSRKKQLKRGTFPISPLDLTEGNEFCERKRGGPQLVTKKGKGERGEGKRNRLW